MLRRFGLTDDAAARAIHELDTARAVVLVEASQIAASNAQARLEELAHAA
jgi:hypothetical protein